MQSINLHTILVFLLLLAGCTNNKQKAVSHVDVTRHESDTFPNALSEAEKVAYTGEDRAADFLPALLDTLTINRYISDVRNKDSIYNNLKKFYSLTDGQLAWYSPEKPEKHTEALMKELLQADQHGLDSGDYDVFKLANMQNMVYAKGEVHPFELAMLDVRTTIAAITFAWHLKNGKHIPVQDDGLWLKNWRESSVALPLTSYDFPEVLEELIPGDMHYTSTLKAVKKYEEITKNGGWTLLPDDLHLEEGDSNRYVPALKRQLAMTGDYSGDTTSRFFDEILAGAVMKFQLRHGLPQDGIVGTTTLDALQVSAEDKLGILKTNLERLRWMPENLGDKYIVINIPEYEMVVMENQKEIMNMAVIVGTIENETPVFHDRLEYIVFSPTWTVPKSIIEKEMLPEIRKNPDYFKERDYRVYDSWAEDASELDPEDVDWDKMTADSIKIVQNPSTTNSLGRVKFMMPNSVAIYLHDTPANHLFSENQRTFSHGCIRLERPVEFANYLLKENKEWDEERIRKSLTLDEPVIARLKEHIPVYITYRTAWATSDGLVHFREDIYGLDQKDKILFATR